MSTSKKLENKIPLAITEKEKLVSDIGERKVNAKNTLEFVVQYPDQLKEHVLEEVKRIAESELQESIIARQILEKHHPKQTAGPAPAEVKLADVLRSEEPNIEHLKIAIFNATAEEFFICSKSLIKHIREGGILPEQAEELCGLFIAKAFAYRQLVSTVISILKDVSHVMKFFSSQIFEFVQNNLHLSDARLLMFNIIDHEKDFIRDGNRLAQILDNIGFTQLLESSKSPDQTKEILNLLDLLSSQAEIALYLQKEVTEKPRGELLSFELRDKLLRLYEGDKRGENGRVAKKYGYYH